MTTLDIIIINRNTAELTGDCIRSIQQTVKKVSAGIIVVDNASTDGSAEIIESTFPEVRVVRSSGNIGYAAAFNLGCTYSTADYAIVSNSDILYHDGALDTMVEYMERNPRVGVCAPQQVYPNGKWQASYGAAPSIKDIFSALTALIFIRRFLYTRFWNKLPLDRKAKGVDYVDGAVMCFRRTALQEVQGFDESFLFFVEDADICRRLWNQNWKVIFLPDARVTHIRGGTRAKDLNREKHYYAMNMHFRYKYGRRQLGAVHFFLYGALTIAYYAGLATIYKTISLFPAASLRQTMQHKYQISKHLVRVCYNELIQKNTLTPSL